MQAIMKKYKETESSIVFRQAKDEAPWVGTLYLSRWRFTGRPIPAMISIDVQIVGINEPEERQI